MCGYSCFCAISRYAEIVLARISIWRPMFIEPTGEMTLIARRVGVGLLDVKDCGSQVPVVEYRKKTLLFIED